EKCRAIDVRLSPRWTAYEAKVGYGVGVGRTNDGNGVRPGVDVAVAVAVAVGPGVVLAAASVGPGNVVGMPAATQMRATSTARSPAASQGERRGGLPPRRAGGTGAGAAEPSSVAPGSRVIEPV